MVPQIFEGWGAVSHFLLPGPSAGKFLAPGIRVANDTRRLGPGLLIIFIVIASPSAALRINSAKPSLLSFKRLLKSWLRACGLPRDN